MPRTGCSRLLIRDAHRRGGLQRSLSQRHVLAAPVEHPVHQVQRFRAVAGGDVGDQPPLAAMIAVILRIARVATGLSGDRLAEVVQRGEPFGIAGAGHLGGQVAAREGQQEGQTGADRVPGDQQDPRPEAGRLRHAIVAGLVPVLDPPGGKSTPVCGFLGSAGRPPFLPGLAWEGRRCRRGTVLRTVRLPGAVESRHASAAAGRKASDNSGVAGEFRRCWKRARFDGGAGVSSEPSPAFPSRRSRGSPSRTTRI